MMSPRKCARTGALLLALCCIGLLWQACGGGGGGGTNGGVNPTPSSRTPTRTPGAPATLPGEIDTPLPTVTPTIGVHPGGSIVEAAKNAPPGSTVYVAPGTYRSIEIGPGDLQGPITLFADVQGIFTESPPAPVTIDAGSLATAIHLEEQEGLVLDGFTIKGGTEAGLRIVNSSGIVVQHCTITSRGGPRDGGDGVVVDGAEGGLIFDNLVWNKGGAGIRLTGVNDLQIINNTIYGNTGIGIVVGTADLPSTVVIVKNNIIHKNTPLGIAVDPPPTTTEEYEGDFNMNVDGYGDGTPAGAQDLNGEREDPQFILAAAGDFHLGQNSHAIDTGDPDTDELLVSQLMERTTQTDAARDFPPVDLGYHYFTLPATPTRPARPTRTRTPGGTATSGTPGVGTPTPTRTLSALSSTATPTAPAGRPTRTARPTRTPRP